MRRLVLILAAAAVLAGCAAQDASGEKVGTTTAAETEFYSLTEPYSSGWQRCRNTR